MTRTLILFRHGKSNWQADYDQDHDRPLKKRGRKAAAVMGQFLQRAEALPDLIFTSSARRAQETLVHARDAGRWPETPTQVVSGLYEAAEADVLEIIRAADDRATRLLLVGHEPTWSELTSRLIGGGDVRFPTAAMARVDLEAERWQDVAFGQGELVWLVPPRLFTDTALEV